MEIEVDDSLWPIVRVAYPRAFEFRDVERLRVRLEDVMRARGPMVLLYDIEKLDPMLVTTRLRAKVAEEADALVEARAVVAEGVIARSALLRGIYMGYRWLRRTQLHPSGVFRDHATALAWAHAQVESHGGDRP